MVILVWRLDLGKVREVELRRQSQAHLRLLISAAQLSPGSCGDDCSSVKPLVISSIVSPPFQVRTAVIIHAAPL